MSESGDITGAGSGLSAVFVSSFRHSLDPKKRVTIPSDWREQLEGANRLYVLPGVKEKCLYVFPAQEIARRMARISGHSIVDPHARQLSRVLASRSDLVTWDSQGRIRIKDELLAHAGITSRVLLVGAFHKFEVWDPEVWEASVDVDDQQLEDAAKYVGF